MSLFSFIWSHISNVTLWDNILCASYQRQSVVSLIVLIENICWQLCRTAKRGKDCPFPTGDVGIKCESILKDI